MTARRLALVLLSLLLPLSPWLASSAGGFATVQSEWSGSISREGLAALAVIDHEAGRVRMISSMAMRGLGTRLLVLVPTPTRPIVRPVDREIWSELSAMTALGHHTRHEDGNVLGCQQQEIVADAPVIDPTGGLERMSSSDYRLTLVADTAFAGPGVMPLLLWLQNKGFTPREEEAQDLQALMLQGWWINIFHPDGTTPLPSDRYWTATTEPLLFDYAATDLTVPTVILTHLDAQVTLCTLDPHRMNWPGTADTWYANRISPPEMTSIQSLYPTLAGFAAPGLFLTRLELRPYSDDTLSVVVPADRDTEFRLSLDGAEFPVVDSVLLVLAPVVAGGILRRRERRK